MSDTKQKILDTAERLFGANGIDATSLRQIISEAGVNLAAIHYHFGSKEELLDALISRRVTSVNERRMALLEEAECKPGGPSVEQVLEALLLPMIDVAEKNPQTVQVMGRIQAEGLMPAIMARHFQAVIARFRAALKRALPDLPEEEFLWRLHFMVGAMAHTMCGFPDFTGLGKSPDFRGRMERLVVFLSGGFRAPVIVKESRYE